MKMTNADFLREFIIEIMIENVQVQAAICGFAPILHLDMMGTEYDNALRQINDARTAAKKGMIDTSLCFKMDVLGTVERRFEELGRVRG